MFASFKDLLKSLFNISSYIFFNFFSNFGKGFFITFLQFFNTPKVLSVAESTLDV